MNKFKELKVWQDSIDLVSFVYSLTNKFSKKEIYGIVFQINRSVVSIPLNMEQLAIRSSK